MEISSMMRTRRSRQRVETFSLCIFSKSFRVEGTPQPT